MTRAFSPTFKQLMVERMTGKDAISATRLAAETGIHQQTLSRWLDEARGVPPAPRIRSKERTWSLDERIRILGEAARVDGAALAALLEREGLPLGELEQWRRALAGGNGEIRIMRRIRKLERELARKDKALADAAALLVLSRRVERLAEADDDDAIGGTDS